jgi:hypothetical protein
VHELRSTLVRGERRTALASKPAAGSARPPKKGSLAGIAVRREESRRCNQRGDDRHVELVECAVVRFQRKLHEVTVRNVSARGTMIESELLPRIGARLDIRFAGCNDTGCIVRWVRGGRIGLEFDRETLVIGEDDHRRRLVSGRRQGEQATFELRKQRAPRQSSMLVAALHWLNGSTSVRLRNISASGAMIQAGEDVDEDREIVLEIPDIAAIPGRVRWCRSGQIGIHFDQPFDLATLTRPAQPSEKIDYVKPDYLRSDGDPNSPWAARWTKLTAGDL